MLILLLAVATFGSEDAACAAAGVLVAHGRIGMAGAVLGCAVGIFAGDVGLFAAGRIIGRRIVARWPFDRMISPASLATAAASLEARGAWVILASRFLPGTRVATYVAAGVLGLDPWLFMRAFAAAALLWTPLLVGVAAVTASGATPALPTGSAAGTVVILAAFVGALQLIRSLLTHGGRRRLVGAWCRITRWEFWPPWVFYPPVLAWIAWLMVRHRSLTVFTAANPGMPAAGFVGESKSEILRYLQDGDAPVAPFAILRGGARPERHTSVALSFAERHGWPLVIKPDQGQRGRGVRIVRSSGELTAAVSALPHDTILQAYVPGVEFGIFYARRLGETCGRIVSLTDKRMPTVTGDGRRTLEQLILDDPRAVALWRVYSAANTERLHTEVPAGAGVPVCEIGSHCRGAVFLDGHHMLTPALEAAVDGASRAMPGFFFGRFDVRSASPDDLRAGRFTILELNGVTSEPTHIYDPGYGVVHAYRALAASWALAFAIGAEQAAAGARVWRVRELAGLAFAYRRFARASIAVTSHP